MATAICIAPGFCTFFLFQKELFKKIGNCCKNNQVNQYRL